jgi:TM2 domain-containing membrane protein YozV
MFFGIEGFLIWAGLGLGILLFWILDLFLIPAMDREADGRFMSGENDYTVAWLLLAFLGVFGVHRFYLGKWITGLIYLCTGGLLGFGLLYDLCTLNGQVDRLNRGAY